MLNVEKYKDKLIELVKDSTALIAVVNGEPTACKNVACEDCDYGIYSCNEGLLKWMFAEYDERIVLSKRQRGFCEMIQTGWLACDTNGRLYYYEGAAPTKEDWYCKGSWQANGKAAEPIYIKDMFPAFPFITYENSPISIEKLLEYPHE